MALAAAVIMVPSANASVCASTTDCIFNLNSTEVVAFGAGPYGTVELKLDGSAIDFTVDLADGFGFNLIDSGTHEAFSFNNEIGGTLALSGFSSSLYSDYGAGPGTNPPFSSFTNAVKSSCTNGSGCGVNKLTFAVNRTGGFTDVNQLIGPSTGNGTVAYFAADIANLDGVTGVVGATGAGIPNTVPEPVSSGLMGIGLIAMGLLRRRRNSRTGN
ncbi:MAG: PEP-CTERM sorting domain-containing protein [Bryobacteraceae bacterium]